MKFDEQIRKNVEEELTWNPQIDASQIKIAARNGVVTLYGVVKSYAEKVTAEKAALQVKGVNGLANEIEVKVPFVNERTDTQIVEAAINALNFNVLIPTEHIKVKAEKGWITLTGEVDWNFQREEAKRTVTKLGGVLGVVNYIGVKPQTVNDMDVKSRISKAFHRHADLDSHSIDVTINEDVATLTGKLNTWHERKEAEKAAWSAPGIKKVDNRIEVIGYVPSILEEA